MKLPFDENKLETLMDEIGADLILVSSKENVQYFLGGYRFFFFAHKDALGISRYLPLLGYPKSQKEKSFYIGNAMEDFQHEVEPLWVENILNNQWLTEKAGVDAALFIRKIGLGNGTIAVEKAFLPADTYDSLQKELPNANFIDAAWALEELRVIKTPEELKKLKSASEKIIECMTDVMQTTAPGTSTYEIVETMRRKETEMGLSFEYCLTATGPSFNRAPSNAKWENGNIISLDSGGNLDGYLGDLCRMGIMGYPTPLMTELLDEVKSIQTAARATVKPGVTGKEIFESALEEQSKCNHKDEIVFLAHGMGMIQHEAPHLTSEGVVPYPGTYANRPLSPGMVLSIETDMKNPDVGFVKLEDTIVVTQDGHDAYGDERRDWVINQN
ncbi:MAG: Xaa-Pro peptidase family protein [Nitrospinota bacterium]|nr:Xaa-Pro peptidase family protein [Nitrospinota bacterium]